MNPLEIHVEDEGAGPRRIEVPCRPDEPLSALISRLDEHQDLDTDAHAIVELALGSAAILDEGRSLGDLKWPSKAIRLRRVCVELHFESENKRRNFPVQGKWARVHRWGCRAFRIAQDACAHLELREVSPNGAPINERQEIGPSAACKVVWLVKPGPEPNG